MCQPVSVQAVVLHHKFLFHLGSISLERYLPFTVTSHPRRKHSHIFVPKQAIKSKSEQELGLKSICIGNVSVKSAGWKFYCKSDAWVDPGMIQHQVDTKHILTLLYFQKLTIARLQMFEWLSASARSICVSWVAILLHNKTAACFSNMMTAALQRVNFYKKDIYQQNG